MLKTLKLLMKLPKFILLTFLLEQRIKIAKKKYQLEKEKELNEKLKGLKKQMKKKENQENISPAKELPKFPDEEETESGASSPTSLTGEEKAAASDIDVQALSKDVVVAIFDTAHLIDKRIRPLEEAEADDIGKPLAKVCVKHDLGRYLKNLSYLDEAMLFYKLGKAVMVRYQEVKETPKETKNDRSDGRKEGEGENAPNQKPNTAATV